MTNLIESFATRIGGEIGKDIFVEKGRGQYLSGERSVNLIITAKSSNQQTAFMRLYNICKMRVAVNAPPYFVSFDGTDYIYKCNIEVAGNFEK
ncbi:MAG: hypothetical protein RSA97_02270 [Oscillospiraceae bacterium]